MVSRALRKERKNNVALSQNGPVAPDHALWVNGIWSAASQRDPA